MKWSNRAILHLISPQNNPYIVTIHSVSCAQFQLSYLTGTGWVFKLEQYKFIKIGVYFFWKIFNFEFVIVLLQVNVKIHVVHFVKYYRSLVDDIIMTVYLKF